MGLTIDTESKSHNITSLVINTLGGTHTHTHIPMWEQKQFQKTRRVLACVPGLKN